MYFNDPLNGASLPPKTLCLTYDDGPAETPGVGRGPHSLKLAEYLAGEGIRATFFMAGKDIESAPELLPQISSLGHLIGNHTFNHPNLIDQLATGGSVVDQVLRADVLLKRWVDHPITFFRPPYGAWSDEVAASLNASLMASLGHTGPVNWDIDGVDWSFWRDLESAETCAEHYLDLIHGTDHGIVLMHDSTTDVAISRIRNLTCAMTQILVPILRDEGYEFVGLDEIPDIALASDPQQRCALRARNGAYLSPQLGGGAEINVDADAPNDWEVIAVEYLAPGKVALIAPNGQYLSCHDGGGGEVTADGPVVGEWEPLDLIPIGDNEVAFRTVTGHFLATDAGAERRLTAEALSLTQAEIFTFEAFGPPV